MSYSVRDDNATFGAGASVEIPNGAGASTQVKLQIFEALVFTAETATSFAASTDYTIYISPLAPSNASLIAPLGAQYQILGATHFYSTAATGAATYTVEVCPSGTANGSGRTAISGAALNTALANAPANLTLSTNVDNLVVNPGDRINLNVGSTATTALVDFNVTIYLGRVA
jgi:hypothetical protein